MSSQKNRHAHFNHKHKQMKPKANQMSQTWTSEQKTVSHLSIKLKKRCGGELYAGVAL